ncbi:MAG: hypothetical protein K2M69_06525 [Muribaculaceae bacterium]|nr:hypothetical protein [Muribaculaceae bacterium]
MNENLVIVVSPADAEAVKDFKKDFEGREVNLKIVEFPSEAPLSINLEDEANCLLWLTPRTDAAVYELSKTRKYKGFSSLNIIPERFSFSPEQREKVGRNPSVILSLTKGDVLSAILSRLNRNAVAVQTAAYQTATETQSYATNISNSASLTLASVTEKSNESYEDNPEKDGIEEYDPYGYQWTAIISFAIIHFVIYNIFGDIRSDNLFYHVLFLVEGMAGGFCLIQALAGFKSKKFWRCIKSILCALIGLFGIIAWLSTLSQLGDLF